MLAPGTWRIERECCYYGHKLRPELSAQCFCCHVTIGQYAVDDAHRSLGQPLIWHLSHLYDHLYQRHSQPIVHWRDHIHALRHLDHDHDQGRSPSSVGLDAILAPRITTSRCWRQGPFHQLDSNGFQTNANKNPGFSIDEAMARGNRFKKVR